MTNRIPSDSPAAPEQVFYFLGSSVTYGEATGGVSFVERLAEMTDWRCVKEAVSGTTLADTGPDSYPARMRRNIPSGTRMDGFVCQLSTNDAGQEQPLGAVSSGRDPVGFDPKTTIGAMETIIAFARENYRCPIIFYTNPPFANKRYEKMIGALGRLRDKWGIGIVDFFHYKDMEPLSPQTLAAGMADEIHPNARGYAWMAGILRDFLERAVVSKM